MIQEFLNFNDVGEVTAAFSGNTQFSSRAKFLFKKDHVGAMLSRFYFARRFGLHQWRLYGPVLLAGYACGTGLVGMTGIAMAIILKSVRVLPF